jgi:hypothetical protein
MKLPGELRNQIYKICLESPEGVKLYGTIRGFRRVVQRWRPSYGKSGKDNKKDFLATSTPLLVWVLRVSKTIHEEAGTILYGQHLYLEDFKAARNFMCQIGPRHHRFLRELEIFDCCAPSFTTMAILSQAACIRSLEIDGHLSKIFELHGPVGAAKEIYRDYYVWFEAIGNARGDRFAGMDIINLGLQKFRTQPSADEILQKYHAELKRLLSQG